MSDTQNRQYEVIAAGAGALALIAALSLRRWPRWLRAGLFVLLLGIAGGAAIVAYRQVTAPTTLTVAAGSLDGDVPKLMTALAARLAATNAPVRLIVQQKNTTTDAAETFTKGLTDLAVVRADSGNLGDARTVITVGHAVALLLASTGTQSIDDLKGKSVGVVGMAVNQDVVKAISRQYDLERSRVTFRDLLPAEVPQAFQGRQVQALLVVLPISEKYVARIREALLRNPKLKVTLIPIEAASAIAGINKAYESFEVPKGTIRGSPAVPDDDLTTLRVPLYLVAHKKLGDEVAGALAKAMFETRRELAGDFPLLSQITEPDTDADAFVPVHPGAKAYFAGEQKTFFDKYGDNIFYGSILFGTAGSLLAGFWRFLTRKADTAVEPPLTRLFAVMRDIRAAKSEAELARAEDRIDTILGDQLDGCRPGDVEAGDAAALSLATHRLERLLEHKRAELRSAAHQPVAAT